MKALGNSTATLKADGGSNVAADSYSDWADADTGASTDGQEEDDAATSGSNTVGGTIAGIVVGLLLVGGAIVGVFIWRRRKRSQSVIDVLKARDQLEAGRTTVSTSTNPMFQYRNGSTDDSAALGTRNKKCTRPSPKGGVCKNNAVQGTSFCKGHTCPAAGCIQGKSTKMETCLTHVHSYVYAEPVGTRK